MTNSKPTYFTGIRTRLANIELKDLFLFTIGAYFLVGMHYYQPHFGGVGLDTPINPIGWIVISILVALGIHKIAKEKKIQYNSFIFVLTIGCLLLLVPLIYTQNTGWYSHRRLLGLFAGLAVLFSVIQMDLTKDDFYKILKFILFAVFIESIMALIQFYILPYQSQFELYIKRPSAIFVQANVAATFFVTGLLISVFLLQQMGENKHSKFYLFILHATPVTTAIVIFLLQSRTGFLGLIVGVILLLLAKNRARKKWLALVLLGILIAIISLALLERHTRDSGVYSNPGVRSQIYSDTIDLIKQEPLLGHGYGTFWKAFQNIQAKKYSENPEHRPIYMSAHPHNEILLWLVEGGLVALIAIALILSAIVYIILKQRSQAYFKLALLFPLALHTLTELPFYHSVASWLLFLLLLAFVSNQPTKALKITIARPLLFSSLSTLIVIITTVQMLSLLVSQRVLVQVFIEQRPAMLFDIALPFVSDDFEQVLRETKLKIAIENNQQSGVNDYINWASRQISVAPRPEHYRNLIAAHLHSKEITQAKNLLNLARYLFPTLVWEEANSTN